MTRLESTTLIHVRQEPSGEDGREDDGDDEGCAPRGDGLHAGKEAGNPRKKGPALPDHDPRAGGDARSERQKENDPPLENASRKMMSRGRKASRSDDDGARQQEEGKARNKGMAKSNSAGRGLSSSSGADQKLSARVLKSSRTGSSGKVGCGTLLENRSKGAFSRFYSGLTRSHLKIHFSYVLKSSKWPCI